MYAVSLCSNYTKRLILLACRSHAAARWLCPCVTAATSAVIIAVSPSAWPLGAFDMDEGARPRDEGPLLGDPAIAHTP
jgi:hypothetical protein